MERFSERLQELRKEKNATKEDLAAHLGITVRAYRYYEEGKRYPDFQGLIALADYFGVTLDDLVGRTAQGYKDGRAAPTGYPAADQRKR